MTPKGKECKYFHVLCLLYVNVFDILDYLTVTESNHQWQDNVTMEGYFLQ